MPRPPAPCFLKQWMADGPVAHSPGTHRYRLGPLAFERGVAGSTMYDVRDLCEPAMAELQRVGAGGLAILAAIAPEERARIIARVAPALPVSGMLTESALREACAHSAGMGAAVIQNRVSQGVTAVGAHSCDSMGQPSGAISGAALTQRMAPARVRLAARQAERCLRAPATARSVRH